MEAQGQITDLQQLVCLPLDQVEVEVAAELLFLVGMEAQEDFPQAVVVGEGQLKLAHRLVLVALVGQEWQLLQLISNYGRTICYFECRRRMA
jgi:hypothetical protein